MACELAWLDVMRYDGLMAWQSYSFVPVPEHDGAAMPVDAPQARWCEFSWGNFYGDGLLAATGPARGMWQQGQQPAHKVSRAASL